MNSEFKKFMSPYKKVWLIIAACLGVLAVAATIVRIIRGMYDFVPIIVLLVFALAALLPVFIITRRIKNIENAPSFHAMELDFDKAVSMNRDLVRLGETYVFMKGSGRIVEYGDIKQVYQYIHKTNFAEDKRSIVYVDINGKRRTMCKLKLLGKSDEDVKAIFAVIINKNPAVKIGYR